MQLKMETVCSSETSGNFYETTSSHIQEDGPYSPHGEPHIQPCFIFHEASNIISAESYSLQPFKPNFLF
jgi:hypothetical protein